MMDDDDGGVDRGDLCEALARRIREVSGGGPTAPAIMAELVAEFPQANLPAWGSAFVIEEVSRMTNLKSYRSIDEADLSIGQVAALAAAALDLLQPEGFPRRAWRRLRVVR